MRVFPRRTKATPRDDLVRVACPPGLFDEADEVHISVAFTWDLPAAERLAKWHVRGGASDGWASCLRQLEEALAPSPESAP